MFGYLKAVNRFWPPTLFAWITMIAAGVIGVFMVAVGMFEELLDIIRKSVRGTHRRT